MRAYVVGNVALDETISVADLPRPGASILGREFSRDLGGKGANQAVVLARSGLAVRLVTAVGADARGSEIRARLEAEGAAEGLNVVDASSDNSIILASDRGENIVVTTNAAAEALSPQAAIAELWAAGSNDLLAMQGNMSSFTTAAVLRAARERGMTTAVNPSPLRPYFADLWPLVDLAFLNEGEAAALGGAPALLGAGVRQVVLTLGARGARLISAEREEHVPAAPARPVDPTGAGDCFMATALASSLRRRCSLDSKALRHAALAAALTVERPGTMRAFPTPEEMTAILATL
jgi:ribokinase